MWCDDNGTVTDAIRDTKHSEWAYHFKKNVRKKSIRFDIENVLCFRKKLQNNLCDTCLKETKRNRILSVTKQANFNSIYQYLIQ